MYAKDDLRENLSELGINPDGTLMVHLSYKAIGEVEGSGDAVLDVLCDYMRRGLLVLPSHTWSNVSTDNPVMDVLYTPSCVGVLPEMFRKRPGVRRSLHPSHSLAALGKDADDFLSGDEHVNTPCGKGGTYFKLWERDAQILLIGVSCTRNTFIHGIEEWDGAEGSISAEKKDFYVIDYDGNRLHTPLYTHCAPLGSETFSKIEPFAYQQGALTFGRFGDATARLMSAAPLRELAASFIKADARYFLRH